jgi:hypothetical protein
MPSDNICIWEAKFAAPEQSLYKGGNLKIQIVLPYPFQFDQSNPATLGSYPISLYISRFPYGRPNLLISKM